VDASKLDAFEHAVKTLIGAARRGEQAIEGIKRGGSVRRKQRGGRKPSRFDR
jgi:hypothetical protein